MRRVLETEFIKLKGSPVLWISAAGVATAPILNGLIMAAYKSQGGLVDWLSFMNQSIAFVAMFLGAPLFGLVTAYLFGREYAEDTLKSLLTAPVRRTWIVTAKMAVLLVWSLALGLTAWTVSLIIGAAVVGGGLSWAAAATTLGWAVTTVLLIYATLPILAWITMLARGYLPPIGFALVTTLAGFVFLYSDKYGDWFPWAVPTEYVLSAGLDRGVARPGTGSWAVMGTLFALGTLLCLLRICRAEADK